MAGTFKLGIHVVKSGKNLATLPERINTAVQRELHDHGLDFIERLKRERLAGRPGLNKRTGEFARSFKVSVTGTTLKNLALKVYSKATQANLQEYGGTVKPTTSKFLAIPLQAVMTNTGVARGSPRDYRNTFFAWSRNGNLILFQKVAGTASGRKFLGQKASARAGSIIPLFVMKSEVTVPARLGMHDLWNSDAVKINRGMRLRSAISSAIHKKAT